MTIRKKILLSTFCILTLLPALSFAATQINLFPTGFWGPLVSCSGAVKVFDASGNATDNPNACTSLCDLIDTFLRLIYFGMTVALFILTPVFFAWGGLTILVAGGDPGKLGEGKKILTGTLVGIMIVLGAFLIVSTFVKFLGVANNPATGKPFIPGFDSSVNAFTCQVR